MGCHLTAYHRSLRQLRDAIDAEKPDVVVNFFELLGGLTYGLYRPSAPMVCVGHQCIAFHAGFPFPASDWLERLLFKGLVRLNAWRATELFGLSFNEQPGVPIRYFYAHATRPEASIDDTLHYCRFDSLGYLQAIQHCWVVMTTAGFESVCEALYQGKPVQMFPQSSHYEKACSALDEQRAGAGVAVESFDLTKLMAHIPILRVGDQPTFPGLAGNGSDTGRSGMKPSRRPKPE